MVRIKPDLPEDNKVHWLVMYKFPEVLEEYKGLRDKGHNPYSNLEMFGGILSYGTVWGRNSDKVVPKMRENREDDWIQKGMGHCR